MDKKSADFTPLGLDRSALVDPQVKQALARVPRHLFVPVSQRSSAYQDRAVSIGKGQTISQPFIVALMTQEAKIEKGTKVLEVGTGSGYQAAVLAELGAKVFSIEIIPELNVSAEKTLEALGYAKQVQLKQGDGAHGWPEQSPFDVILITAASPRVPTELLEQLNDGGRMLLPLEEQSGDYERLLLIEKHGRSYTTKEFGKVRFVPLTGAIRDTSSESENHPFLETLMGIPGGEGPTVLEGSGDLPLEDEKDEE